MVLRTLIKVCICLACLWSTDMCTLPKTSYVFYIFTIYVLSIVAGLEAQDGFGRGDSKPGVTELSFPIISSLSLLCVILPFAHGVFTTVPTGQFLTVQTCIPCGPHTYGPLSLHLKLQSKLFFEHWSELGTYLLHSM